MSDINCDCGYNYTQTGCPNCKHIPIDYTQEYEQALANMQREYDKRGDRIEELEEQLKTILDRETSILRYYDAKLDAAEAKLAKAVEALRNVVEEYDLFRKDEYERGMSPLDDEIHDARTTLVAVSKTHKLKGEQL